MGRPKGYRLSAEAKERIGKGISNARHASSIQTQEYYRSKIRTGMIVSTLQQHVEGKREMSATQIQAGLGLLRKVLPDLATHELTASNGATTLTIITGVVRAEDLEANTKTIEHIPDPSQEGKS